MKNQLVILFLILSFSSQVFGHARLRSDGSIPPRNNNAGLKSPPCGGVARTNSNTTLTAGETITITWEETINHPGYFEFAFSQGNDQNFVRVLVVQDNQNNRNDLPHQYSAQIQVPDITCQDCTFQLIQVMTENPNNPSLYYSCADINIVAGAEPPSEEMPEPVEPAPVPRPTPPISPPSGSEQPSSDSDTCH